MANDETRAADLAAERLDSGYDGPLPDVLPQALMDARKVVGAYLAQRTELDRLRTANAELAAALGELVAAITAEVNEKGAGGFLLARMTDARAALARHGAGKGGGE